VAFAESEVADCEDVSDVRAAGAETDDPPHAATASGRPMADETQTRSDETGILMTIFPF
jgi:hypothetical protein